MLNSVAIVSFGGRKFVSTRETNTVSPLPNIVTGSDGRKTAEPLQYSVECECGVRSRLSWVVFPYADSKSGMWEYLGSPVKFRAQASEGGMPKCKHWMPMKASGLAVEQKIAFSRM